MQESRAKLVAVAKAEAERQYDRLKRFFMEAPAEMHPQRTGNGISK